jgi:hypothetical protein
MGDGVILQHHTKKEFMPKPKIRNEYVNNAELLAALIKHRKAVAAAKKKRQPAPQFNEYIGICFLKIAEHLSRKPNFMSYTFREDMVADAVENCIQYGHNFDPAKSEHPFAYFTQIIAWAFLRRISKEKKELYVKYKATEQLGFLQPTERHDLEELGHGAGRPFSVYENISDFIQAFEQSRKAKKRKKMKISACSGTLRFIGDK